MHWRSSLGPFLLLACTLGSCANDDVHPRIPEDLLATIAGIRQGVPKHLRDYASFVDEVTDAPECSYRAGTTIAELREVSTRAKQVAGAYEREPTATNEDQAIYALRRMSKVLQLAVITLPCMTEENRYRYDRLGELGNGMANKWEELFTDVPLK